MEDEGFVDDDFLAETAWEYVGVHGRAGLVLLDRLVGSAEKAGDPVSAETWRAVREMAEAILSRYEAAASRDGI
ncbi:MAG TPA: hypothetical protein VJR70_06060 [Stellaceae bacterium]|nr:hypothetical protein [Stellaceae bacterium]